MIRAVLDRSVGVLVVLAVLGAAGLWRFTSWNVAANSVQGVTTDTSQDQRMIALMILLPYLLSPAAATVLVAALIGLPIVIGARYAAIVRSRADGADADPPTPTR